MSPAPEILFARGLRKEYSVRTGKLRRFRGRIRAVDDVRFSIAEGETLALVGESGAGKSTIGRLLVRLEEPTAGTIRFRGRDLLAMSGAELRAARKEIQIVFQDPFGSLNPRLRAGDAVREVLSVHGIAKGAEGRERAADLLRMVGLSRQDAGRFPHEFSGGQRQRVCIARALAVSPSLLVADEPTSSLDVSTQAQILELLRGLRERLRLSYLLITHDLAIVRHVADRVAVLYLGKIVESGPVSDLFRSPLHPYTEALLASAPSGDPDRRFGRPPLAGEPPSALERPSGCPFHPRCPRAGERCREEAPREVEPEAGSTVTCHLHDGGTGGEGAPHPSPAGRPLRPS